MESDSKSPKSPKKDESIPSSFASRMIPSIFKGKNDHEQKVHISRKGSDHTVEINERVVTFAGDAPVRGTVRYIGEDKDSHGQVHTIVGLELVSDIVNVVVTCRIHTLQLARKALLISFQFFLN